MTNKQKYAEEILDIACAGGSFAFDKHAVKAISCYDLNCDDCLFNGFYGGCSEKIKKWAESEYVEPVKISKRDRMFLDYIEGYKYIARDGDGELYVYITKPKKGLRNWADARFKSLAGLDIDLPMVKWSDDEPWKIEDLKELEVVDEY